MITWLAPGVFASSNDESSIIVWSSPAQNWTDLEAAAPLKYDPSLGVANSGDAIVLNNRVYLAVGHANGFISFWSGSEDGTGLELYKAVNLRNPKLTNPWGLHNIRGVSTMLSSGSTASEGEQQRDRDNLQLWPSTTVRPSKSSVKRCPGPRADKWPFGFLRILD